MAPHCTTIMVLVTAGISATVEGVPNFLAHSKPSNTSSNMTLAAVCSAQGEPCTFTPGAGISSWFTEAEFNSFFPYVCDPRCSGCNLFTYPCLIEATLMYPDFASSPDMDMNRREVAAWLAQMSQETTGGGCNTPTVEHPDGSCSCGPTWCDGQPNGGCAGWGMCIPEERIPPQIYCDLDSTAYPCVPGKTYWGRGPKMLSWNFNYGQFSEDYCGDKSILLNNPEWIATNPKLAWASSIWFWFSGGACNRAVEICKPGCHEVMLELKKKCPADLDAGRKYGLGWVTNVINGGLECGGQGEGKCDNRVFSRVRFYKHFCEILGVNSLAPGWTDDSNLFCVDQLNYLEADQGGSPPTEC